MSQRLHLHILIFLLLAIAMLFPTACFIRRAPQTGMEPATEPENTPATSPQPKSAEMRVLKVSGAGNSNIFAVKLEWTGDKPAEWKINRWTVMWDQTGQTQSMLVVEDQTFTINPGEPRTVQVKAIPLDPAKPAARHLIVDYEGMPVYVLTKEIPNPDAKKVIASLDTIDAALRQMIPLVRFVGSSIEYSPKDRGKIEPYLEVVVWNMDGDKPTPYIEQTVIEDALVVAIAGGMTEAGFNSFLQSRYPGISSKDAAGELRRLKPKINRLLELAGTEARITAK